MTAEITIGPRAFRDDDWDRAIALLEDAWTSAGPQTRWHVGDISWWVRDPDWRSELLVWQDGADSLAGLASYDSEAHFELAVAPRYLGGAIHARMLADMERLHEGEEARADELGTFAAEDNVATIALLERRGYANSGWCVPLGSPGAQPA